MRLVYTVLGSLQELGWVVFSPGDKDLENMGRITHTGSTENEILSRGSRAIIYIDEVKNPEVTNNRLNYTKVFKEMEEHGTQGEWTKAFGRAQGPTPAVLGYMESKVTTKATGRAVV